MNRIPVITLEKPAIYSPCNSCGMCCIVQVCDLGVALGDSEKCKALIANADNTYTCGLVADPYSYIDEASAKSWKKIDSFKPDEKPGEAALKVMYAEMLGAGRGCDSEDWF